MNQGQVTLDLVCVARVQSLEVVWEAAFAKHYDIQASVDGRAWRTITSATGHAGHMLHNLGNKRARFIRLTCQEGSSYWGCSMFELVLNGRLQVGIIDMRRRSQPWPCAHLSIIMTGRLSRRAI